MSVEIDISKWPNLEINFQSTPNDYTWKNFIERLKFYIDSDVKIQIICNLLDLESLPIKYLRDIARFVKSNKEKMRKNVNQTLLIIPPRYSKIMDWGINTLIKPSNPCYVITSSENPKYKEFFSLYFCY